MPEAAQQPPYPRGLRALVHPRGPIVRRLPAWVRTRLLGPLYRAFPLSLRRHLLYVRHHGRWGNFRTPRRFSEKMQWRIINDRRALLGWTADKLAHKEYARTALAARADLATVRIPRTYWAGSDVRELRERSAHLPDAWVFKPNHSSGRFRVYGAPALGESAPNWDEIEQLGRAWSHRDEESRAMGHWAYSQARIGLLAEERIGDRGEPLEVRVLCYGGTPTSILLREGHLGSFRYTYYDAAFTAVDARRTEAVRPVERETSALLTDAAQEQIRATAAALAAPFDFVRIDLYLHDGVLWVGEITPYSSSGLISFRDDEDVARGALWTLPNLRAHDPREGEWRALVQGPLRGEIGSG